VVARPRLALTLVASGLLALVLQDGCAESTAVDFVRQPDAGSGGSTSTGGQPATGGAGGQGGLLATGGDGGVSGTGGIMPAPGGTGGAATFAQIYQSILTVRCAGSQCHSPGKQGGVNFASLSSAYASLKTRIEPGDAEASSFYALLNAGVMPPTGDNLSPAELAAIASWIDAGAAND
jgi:Cytochrome C oxidase, cbb3-type, subunit III